MYFSFIKRSEKSGRFDDDVDIVRRPREFGRVFFLNENDLATIIDKSGLFSSSGGNDSNIKISLSVRRIVLEKIRHIRKIAEVIDRNDLEFRTSAREFIESAADATETVDCDAYFFIGHRISRKNG